MENSNSPISKKIAIGVIVVICLVVVGIVGIFGYNWHVRQEQIDMQINIIEKAESEFRTVTEREEKLEVLKGLLDKYNTYSKEKEVIDEVIEKYESTIQLMQSHFTSEYDDNISKYTISDIDTLNDKETINSNISNLQNLLTCILGEKGIVTDDVVANVYKEQIETLIQSYEDRIAVIDKQALLDSYNASVLEYTIDNVESVNDKKKLNSASDNLKTLLDTIKADTKLNEKEVADYQTQIENLIFTYESRIEEIKKQEAKAQESTNNTTNNNNTTSNNQSESDWRNNIDGHRLPDPLWDINTSTWEWSDWGGDDPDDFLWYDDKGNVYDRYGNYLGNINNLLEGG